MRTRSQLALLATLGMFISSCDGCVDVEGSLPDGASDAIVDAPDDAPTFDASLTNVVLGDTQLFEAAASVNLAAITSWLASAGVSVVIAWGDGTTTSLGSLANGVAISQTHQFEALGTYSVSATMCVGTDCVEQTLGTVQVVCSAPGFDDCSGGIADGCETSVDSDIMNCGGCGVQCDQTTSACTAADTCAAGVCQPNHAPAATECRASAGTCDVAESCDGAGACPADTFAAPTTECRASAGACDAAEMCTGASADCPADVVAPTTTECRASTGACDVAEMCDGVSVTCAADSMAGAGTVCRASADTCDVDETCDGSSAACPADAMAPATTECRASAGACDVAEMCTGTAVACPSDTLLTLGTECRAQNGTCDLAESCTGASATCPSDGFVAVGAECRAQNGACDVAEACTGSSGACPSDAFVSIGTECRASAGTCDVAETCSGASGACPSDARVALGTECRAQNGVCDIAETCDGVAVACPADAVASNVTECRASAGACDAAETCDGMNNACPADILISGGTTCRPSAGACDVLEACTGSSAACPADAFESAATVCRASGGVCDTAESCTGSSAACPTDNFVPSSTVCRASAGVCDGAETCTGASAACPVDALLPSSTVCRASAGVCDGAETCTGASAACPADALFPNSTVCRASAGACDTAESCSGASAACPADVLLPNSTVCRASAGVCDTAESCSGSSAACPADSFLSNSTVCRASAGVCDAAETCNGSGAACPSDAFLPNSTVCRASAGVCDGAESCTGSGAACPSDAFLPNSTVCRASAGVCDGAESCTGSGAACPANTFLPNSTVCRASAGVCDGAESCTGSGAACPADAFLPNSTVCRASAGVCDVAESCTGSAAACPVNGFVSASTVCRADADGLGCDAAENCPGNAESCPANGNQPAGTTCNTGGPNGMCQANGTCLTGFSLDTSFGGGDGDVEGVSPSPGASSDHNPVRDGVVIASGSQAGKLLIAGEVEGSNPVGYVARFTAAGVIDTSFSASGYRYYPNVNGGGTPDRFQCIEVQSDGKIIVAGYSNGGINGDDIIVARLNEDGTYDSSFATNGRFTMNNLGGGSDLDRAAGCALQSDGKILLTGLTRLTGGSTNAMFAMRLNTNGTIDTSFGGPTGDNATDPAGVVTDSGAAGAITGRVDQGFDIAVGSTGIYVAGFSRDTSAVNHGVVWRLTTNGRRDTTFDTDGRAVSSPTQLFETVAVDSSGRPVATGNIIGSPFLLVLVRATTAGAWDGAFGSGGHVTLVGQANGAFGNALAFQSDGKIIVGGGTGAISNDNNILTARYNTNGTLDTSFASVGWNAQDDLDGTDTRGDSAASVAVLSTGEIVTFGTAEIAAPFAGHYWDEATVLRYTTGGALDTAFGGGDGKVLSGTTGWREDVAYDLDVQSDGKIVAVGYTNVIGGSGTTENAALWRFNANGTVDTSFGSSGTQYYDNAPRREMLFAVEVDSADRAVAAGLTQPIMNGSFNLSVFRYTTAGALDTTFNGTGLREMTPADLTGGGTGSAQANDVVLQSDGRIVAVGNTSTASSGTDMVVVRLTTAGALDTTFAGDGAFNHTQGGGATSATSSERAFATALQSDGRIIVVGGGASDTQGDNLVVWRLNTNGTLDTSFDSDGVATTGAASGAGVLIDQGRDVLVQPDGKIVVAGVSSPILSRTTMTLWRFNTNGSLDTTFSGDGIYTYPTFMAGVLGNDANMSVLIDSTGLLYVVWTQFVAGGGHDLAIWRLTAGGALDTTFDGDGIYTQHNAGGGEGRDLGHSAVFDGSNRLLVCGETRASGTNDLDGIVWRFQ